MVSKRKLDLITKDLPLDKILKRPKKKQKLITQLQVENMLKSGLELKFKDTGLGPTSLTGGTTLVLGAPTGLLLIAQGDTDQQRNGRKIQLKKVMVNGEISKTANGSGPEKFMIALVLDRQANGAYPAVTSILTSDSDMDAYNNLTNVNRFVILKRKKLILNPPVYYNGATTQYGAIWANIKMNVDLDIPIYYNGTSGAITEITSNNIFLIAGTENDAVVYDLTCRVRYTDGS